MSLAIRRPAADDRALVEAIVADMVAHYRQDAAEGQLARAADRLLAPTGAGPFTLLAVEGGVALGIAIFSETFPARALTPALFLRDVYVTAAARGRGVGRALMAGLARFARDGGYSRIEWLTGRDNVEAQRLYATLGAPVADAVCYRVEGAAIGRMAEA